MATRGRRACELFVSKIPWTIANKELKEYFMQFGPVQRAFLSFNQDTGFHKGYGWVGFKTEEGMNKALKNESHILDGEKIYVQTNKYKFAALQTDKDRQDSEADTEAL
ncbi:SRA stem-loop-interacting RNA-binding protein, mitochondrial [Centropristis striata]|uniref:SRA stem-loop-interacting RNA-binding protein, mitochondrial n=1 Tax=Centropristis striata TaxID=184440 RepID=UPI0027DF5A2E|nr:SRA stem-loop-interacting RNA-binding protein, mitochondrial [Centropristis striata]